MRLEPRVERLEAATPDATTVVMRIELRGHPEGPMSVSERQDNGWSSFEMAGRRKVGA